MQQMKQKEKAAEWQNIFTNDATDKGLNSKIYKQNIQLNNNNKKQTTLSKMGRSKQTFFQKRHADGQKVYENILNITIREMQIKTIIRYHLTPIRMAIIKKSTNKKFQK